MAKITQLPLEPLPDGSETVVMVKDNVTRRAALGGIVGAAVAPHVAAAQLARDQAADMVEVQRIFVDLPLADAEAATAEGQFFKLIDSARGLAEIRLRNATGSEKLYDEVTAAALASPATNKGAGLINSLSRNGTAPRSVSLRLNDAPETPEDFEAVGGGADDATSLTAWLNNGHRIRAMGEWKSESVIGVSNRTLDLDVAAAGKLIFDQQGADTLVFENCTGRIGNLVIDDTRETLGGVRGSIVFRNCTDLLIQRIITIGGKDLPVVMVDCDNCHIIGGRGHGDDANRPFAWEMIGCSNSSIQRVKLSKYRYGFALIGPGYKSGTEEGFMTTRDFEDTLGMRVAFCEVDDHTGHAFNNDGAAGTSFDRCIAKHYTGSVGNAAFQFKQATNIGTENADDTWANIASGCIAYDQVTGFATQQGTDAIIRDCLAWKIKRNGGYSNSTRNVAWENFKVRDWGLDLDNWPIQSGDGDTCSAIGLWTGSDANIVKGLSAEITPDEINTNLADLSLVNVMGANCDIDGVRLRKSQDGTLAAGLVIKGTYTRVGTMNRLNSVQFTDKAGLIDDTATTQYPLNFSKAIDLVAGTYTLDAEIPAGLMVGRVTARKGSGAAVTGTPEYSVGYRGSGAGLVARRAVPTSDVADIAPLAAKAVSPNLYLTTQIFGSDIAGKIIVTVSGVANV